MPVLTTESQIILAIEAIQPSKRTKPPCSCKALQCARINAPCYRMKGTTILALDRHLQRSRTRGEIEYSVGVHGRVTLQFERETVDIIS